MLVAAPSPAASAAAAHPACLCCWYCPVVWPLYHSASFVAVLLAGAASSSCLVCWAWLETATVSTRHAGKTTAAATTQTFNPSQNDPGHAGHHMC